CCPVAATSTPQSLAVLSTLFPYTTLFRSPRPHGGCPPHRAERGPRHPRRVRLRGQAAWPDDRAPQDRPRDRRDGLLRVQPVPPVDRKSTRLNSSHVKISYAVFCLKKKI